MRLIDADTLRVRVKDRIWEMHHENITDISDRDAITIMTQAIDAEPTVTKDEDDIKTILRLLYKSLSLTKSSDALSDARWGYKIATLSAIAFVETVTGVKCTGVHTEVED